MIRIKMIFIAISSLAGLGGALASNNYARHVYCITAVTFGFKVIATSCACNAGTAKVCKISVGSTYAINSTIFTWFNSYVTVARKGT
jgi:hypothetical protein